MKRFALLLCLLLSFGSTAVAQQSQTASDAPASKEDIERYFDAMHVRDMMKSTMDTMTKQMHQVTHGMLQKQSSLPPDAEARLDKTTDEMFKNLPIDDLIQVMIPVYQKHLTKGDVDALVAFYSTPTGQKMIKELPAITAESMQASSGILQKMMAQATQQVQIEIAQMQKDQGGNSQQQ